MAEILSSLSINSTMQKVVEVPNGYIINGHYYDRTTMSPRPLRFFQTYGHERDLSMNKSLMNRHTHDGLWSKTHGDMIIRDNFFPEVFYVWTLGTRSNFQYFYKMRDKDGDVEVLDRAIFSNSPGAAPMVDEYLGQTRDHIFYLVGTGVTGTTHMCRINKVTMAFDYPRNLDTYSVGTLLRETDQHIFYGWQRLSGNTHMFRYNKATNVHEQLTVSLKQSHATSRYFTTRMCDPERISALSDYTYTLNHDFTSNKYYIQKYVLDYSKTDVTQVVAEAPVAINWNTPSTGFEEIKVLPSSPNFNYELFITKAPNNKKYLNISVSNIPGQSNTAQINDLGIYTFEIDETTRDLTFTGFTQIATSLYRGFLPLKDATFLIALTDTTMIFVRFDTALRRFVVQESVNNQPFYVGLDRSENIWIVTGTQEVEMISPFVPKDINIKFLDPAYRFQGTPINTFITIEAKNYNNINISAKFELRLSGPAVFDSTVGLPAFDNGKRIVEDTITTGPALIPITINGAGSITVHPRLIV